MMVLIQSMLRHLMTFGGGFLVADGVVTDADINRMAKKLMKEMYPDTPASSYNRW